MSVCDRRTFRYFFCSVFSLLKLQFVCVKHFERTLQVPEAVIFPPTPQSFLSHSFKSGNFYWFISSSLSPVIFVSPSLILWRFNFRYRTFHYRIFICLIFYSFISVDISYLFINYEQIFLYVLEYNSSLKSLPANPNFRVIFRVSLL